MKMGCNGVAPIPPKGEEERGRATRGDLRVYTSRGDPLQSSPETSVSAEAAPSSGTEITRRLLMEETRVLSWSDRHRSVTSASRDMPPLRVRRLLLWRRGKGACSADSFKPDLVPAAPTRPSKDCLIGRLDRHAHGARGVRGLKQAAGELARPALAARNPEERVHRAKASRQRVQELLNRRVAPPADGRGEWWPLALSPYERAMPRVDVGPKSPGPTTRVPF